MGRGGSDFDAAPLIELADETGGRAEILKNLGRDSGKTDRLKDAVESIAMTLRHRYLVGYEPPPLRIDATGEASRPQSEFVD